MFIFRETNISFYLQKRSGDQISQSSQKIIQNNPTQQMFEAAPASPQKLLSKLEDMKGNAE